MKLRTTIGSRAGRRGFTLIEVLIALSVLGVTMTAVFTLFSSGLKLRSVTQDRMAFDRDARLVLTALADDMANLVPSGPVPMVSPDALVLWRQRQQMVDGVLQAGAPQLVTYQWSGSGFQDSILVRVAAPVTVDVADYKLLHAEFMKWARVFHLGNATASYLLREDHGTRFGDRATLKGLTGSWQGYPSIRGFAFGITEDPDEYNGGNARSRILVKLSPVQGEASFPGLDPSTSLAMLPNDGRGMEAGFWLPISAQVPAPLADVLPEEEMEP